MCLLCTKTLSSLLTPESAFLFVATTIVMRSAGTALLLVFASGVANTAANPYVAQLQAQVAVHKQQLRELQRRGMGADALPLAQAHLQHAYVSQQLVQAQHTAYPDPALIAGAVDSYRHFARALGGDTGAYAGVCERECV